MVKNKVFLLVFNPKIYLKLLIQLIRKEILPYLG
jgi:hypothetical protein